MLDLSDNSSISRDVRVKIFSARFRKINLIKKLIKKYDVLKNYFLKKDIKRYQGIKYSLVL